MYFCFAKEKKREREKFGRHDNGEHHTEKKERNHYNEQRILYIFFKKIKKDFVSTHIYLLELFSLLKYFFYITYI